MDRRADEARIPLLETRPEPEQVETKESLWNRLVWKNGVFLVGLTAFLFSIVLVLVKLTQHAIPNMQILWVRALLFTVGAPLVSKYLEPGASIIGKKANIPGMFALGVVSWLQILFLWGSLAYLSMSDSSAILFSNSIITAIVASILGLDRLSRLTPISVVLTVIGVLLVTRPPALFNKYGVVWDWNQILGMMLAVGACLSLTAILLITRSLKGREGGMTVLFWQYAVNFALSTISLAVGFPHRAVFNLSAKEIVLMIVPATMGIVSWSLLYRSVRLASATVGSVVVRTQLLWSFLFDMLLFGEPFSWISLIGCCCILGGSAVAAFTVVKVDK